MEWGVAYLLYICGASSRGVMTDDHRDIVNMGVDTVYTVSTDVLGEHEHRNFGRR